MITGQDENPGTGVKLTWIYSVIRENDLYVVSQRRETRALDLPAGRQYRTSSSERSLATARGNRILYAI